MTDRARELANRVMEDWPSGTDAWAVAVELWSLLDVVEPQCEIIRTKAAEISALKAENAALRQAIGYYEVGVCAVGVPHEAERKVLHDAVNAARALVNGLAEKKNV